MAYRKEAKKKTLILKITSFPSPDRIVDPHEEGPAVFHKGIKDGLFDHNTILTEIRKRGNQMTGFNHPEDWGLENHKPKRKGFVADLRKIDGEVSETSLHQILKFQQENVYGGNFREFIWAGIVNE